MLTGSAGNGLCELILMVSKDKRCNKGGSHSIACWQCGHLLLAMGVTRYFPCPCFEEEQPGQKVACSGYICSCAVSVCPQKSVAERTKGQRLGRLPIVQGTGVRREAAESYLLNFTVAIDSRLPWPILRANIASPSASILKDIVPQDRSSD